MPPLSTVERTSRIRAFIRASAINPWAQRRCASSLKCALANKAAHSEVR